MHLSLFRQWYFIVTRIVMLHSMLCRFLPTSVYSCHKSYFNLHFIHYNHKLISTCVYQYAFYLINDTESSKQNYINRFILNIVKWRAIKYKSGLTFYIKCAVTKLQCYTLLIFKAQVITRDWRAHNLIGWAQSNGILCHKCMDVVWS